MKVPIANFNDEQKVWFAKLLSKGAIIDRVLDPAEVDYLIKAFHFLEVENKEQLKDYLKKKNVPDDVVNEIPDGITPEIRAAVLSELGLLITADGTLKNSERTFLIEVAKAFGFPPSIEDLYVQWVEKAHQLETDRRKVIAQAIREYEMSHPRAGAGK